MSNAVTAIRYLHFSSPVGWILIATSSEGICLAEFLKNAPTDDELRSHLQQTHPLCPLEPDEGTGLLGEAREALKGYLTSGVPLPAFPVDMRWGTAFQQEVWKGLCRIPFGEVRSYGEVARDIGRPNSARAVGQACGKNPIVILIPCHRVVASGGRLGGFSGGLDLKITLLDIEKNSRDVKCEMKTFNNPHS